VAVLAGEGDVEVPSVGELGGAVAQFTGRAGHEIPGVGREARTVPGEGEPEFAV
jgi:hypothetical protein